ncbi:hypothetical protein Nepgr_027201 [Nepenthes gracilis]|uniref:Uncharacterized protein n=1 Tax=Nepenthes gracilis TaxID=150966 RepID=A0AAD3T9Y4_NEPGR|nr:hypothetical protein Nepgr_027201 [Nepenthes gracilis]
MLIKTLAEISNAVIGSVISMGCICWFPEGCYCFNFVVCTLDLAGDFHGLLLGNGVVYQIVEKLSSIAYCRHMLLEVLMLFSAVADE